MLKTAAISNQLTELNVSKVVYGYLHRQPNILKSAL